MQETWNPKPDMTLEMINAECQKNFKAIIKRSMEASLFDYNGFKNSYLNGYSTSSVLTTSRQHAATVLLKSSTDPF